MAALKALFHVLDAIFIDPSTETLNFRFDISSFSLFNLVSIRLVNSVTNTP